MKITNETKGFTLVVEHKSGGCIGTWEPTMEKAFKTAKRLWDENHTYIRIFPTRYDERMRLK